MVTVLVRFLLLNKVMLGSLLYVLSEGLEGRVYGVLYPLFSMSIRKIYDRKKFILFIYGFFSVLF